MPRARSQYIAEMRERFEVVDRVKASAEEKASLTKAIQQEDDSDPSSVEVTPSKENTLRKDEIKLTFALQDHEEKKSRQSTSDNDDNDNDDVEAIDAEVDPDEKDEDAEIGIKV